MVIFIIGQLLVNYKHGVVWSPFYHYGMYSQKMDIKENYEVWEIMEDGKILKATDYSPQKWDKIILPIEYYAAIPEKSNAMYDVVIKRLLSKAGLSIKEINFLQTCETDYFLKWYKEYLQKITGSSAKEINIQKRFYRFSDKRLLPTDSIIQFNQLCN